MRCQPYCLVGSFSWGIKVIDSGNVLVFTDLGHAYYPDAASILLGGTAHEQRVVGNGMWNNYTGTIDTVKITVFEAPSANVGIGLY